MKKLLSLLLALALVMSLLGCLPANSMQTPLPSLEATESLTEATEAPTQAPTEAPTEEVTEAPTEEVTEESVPEDPRPHPADVQKEQDRLNQEQDWAEQNRQEQEQEREPEQDQEPEQEPEAYPLDPDGYYTSKDEVALYIHIFGWLPGNYITKSEAKSQYGSTKRIPSYLNIGGDRFYNKEGLLPAGHTYYECDIGTSGGSNRGAKRIVFSTDGLIYYTSDHYASFTLLYGEP